ADLVQPLRAAARRQRVDHQPEQRLVAASRKLDRLERRRDGIRLRRPARARPGAARPPLEARLEKSRLDEPLEPRSRDVAMYALRGGQLVGRYCTIAASRIEERGPQVRVADSSELVHL